MAGIELSPFLSAARREMMERVAKPRSEQGEGRGTSERRPLRAEPGLLIDNRPRSIAQRELQRDIQASPYMVAQRLQLDSAFGAAARTDGAGTGARQLKQTVPSAALHKTGLPEPLKSGVESLSGLSMDQVGVHYNSSAPAQLDALAYAQGTEIHLAPGQERHLPHEAWHLVQQAQGRVQATAQLMTGTQINDDPSLEHEADVMGAKAASGGAAPGDLRPLASGGAPAQFAVGFEFQCRYWEMVQPVENSDSDDDMFDRTQQEHGDAAPTEWERMPDKAVVLSGEGWVLSPDAGEPEFIVSHEADDLGETMDDMMAVVTMFQQRQRGPFKLSALGDVDNADAEIRPYPGKRAQDNVSADAQINAGVRYSRLFHLIKDLGNERSEASEQLMGSRRARHYADDAALLSRARANAAKAVEWKEVRDRFTGDPAAKTEQARLLSGFLALIGQYLMKAPQLAESGGLLKDFPLMVRTSMAIAASNSVPEDLRNKGGRPILIRAALYAGERDDGDEMVYGDDVDRSPTIAEWVIGLAKGTDKLTLVDMNLGALKSKRGQENVGSDNAPALVAEFRRVRTDLQWHEWTAFAIGAQSWLERVNQPKGPYTPYKAPK